MELTFSRLIRSSITSLHCCMIVFILFSLVTTANAQTKIIPLWPGVAPGSENWIQKEVWYRNDWDQKKMVRNVTEPTLTAFIPESGKANGTAIIICPGGGYRFLSWESEGTEVADWLCERGVAAFVLKYRLTNTGASEEEFSKVMEEIRESMKRITEPSKPGDNTNDRNRPARSEESRKVVQLAIEDGRQAMRIVRERAAEWNISSDRIGIMGFSAGGGVTMGVVMDHDEKSRPNFAAPIYGGGMGEAKIPDDAPPLFILAAYNDMTSVGSVRLFSEWKSAGLSAELHIYSKGGHGFGMNKRGLPVDTWIERFGDWLRTEGFLGQDK